MKPKQEEIDEAITVLFKYGIIKRLESNVTVADGYNDLYVMEHIESEVAHAIACEMIKSKQYYVKITPDPIKYQSNHKYQTSFLDPRTIKEYDLMIEKYRRPIFQDGQEIGFQQEYPDYGVGALSFTGF